MSKRQDPKAKAVSTRENGYAEEVSISMLKANPSNPRIMRDDRFAKLKKSITEFPDMLNKRPIVAVTDKDGKLMVLGGNMRLRACQDLGLKTVPVVLADEWTEEQRRRFIIADNVGFGEWSWDDLASEWGADDLEDWGLDLPVFASDEDAPNVNMDQHSAGAESYLNGLQRQVVLIYSPEEYETVISKSDQLIEKTGASDRASLFMQMLVQNEDD